MEGCQPALQVSVANLPICQLFTDNSDLGLICYFQCHFYWVPFQLLGFEDPELSTNWQELYAATMALTPWGMQLETNASCSTVTCHKWYTSCLVFMIVLIYSFTMLPMQHSVEILVQHISELTITYQIPYPYSRLPTSESSEQRPIWSSPPQLHSL